MFNLILDSFYPVSTSTLYPASASSSNVAAKGRPDRPATVGHRRCSFPTPEFKFELDFFTCLYSVLCTTFT
jgi:hypothetical protein